MFGYRYDTETGLYYLQSRYYNADWGRFLNADAIVGSVGELLGPNVFAYCKNNPTTLKDPSGFRPIYTAGEETRSMRSASLSTMTTVKKALRTEGAKPNSVEKEYNKKGKLTQERLYGPDGRAKRDTDYGHADHHPDLPSPHYHDWDWSKQPKDRRGDAYARQSIWEPIVGVALLATSTLGIIWVIGNDCTGIGVVDDGAIAPLGAGIAKGVVMIFEY